MRSYLAEIYRLAEYDSSDDKFVGTATVAEAVDLSQPAVNRIVNRLKEDGLLLHKPYQGIQLTQQGRYQALLQLRQHRIAESFLVKVMGFDWQDVYAEAQAISRGANQSITERMFQMAGTPQFCPHGEPIPSAEGVIIDMHDKMLSQVEAGQHFKVTRLQTRDPERLQYIEAIGLLPDTTFEVLHIAPFNGPMQLKLHNEYRIIGHNLAELIRVKVVD
jgi:DtxR family Mn-dependent transcriptional regulator